MAAFLDGKRALALNLPQLQCLPVYRLGLPFQVLAALGHEIAVLQFPSTAPVVFTETPVPHKTAGATHLLCLILPEQAASAAV